MGAAKRRGTYEERVVQSIERKAREEAIRREQFKALEAERLRNLKPQERKEAVLVGGGSTRHHAMLLAAAMSGALAASGTLLVHPTDRKV